LAGEEASGRKIHDIAGCRQSAKQVRNLSPAELHDVATSHPMSTQPRSRPTRSSDTETPETDSGVTVDAPSTPFDANGRRLHVDDFRDDAVSARALEAESFGRTTLNLDHITDEELDAFFFDEEVETSGILNVPTLTGAALIIVGLVYLLAEMGIWTGIALPQIAAFLPWLAGVFVVVLGFGLLSRGRSETKKEREAQSVGRPAAGRASASSHASSASTETGQPSPEAAGSTSSLQTSSSTGSSWIPFRRSGNRYLRRSTSQKRILGVCAGIAEYFNLDPTLVRVAFVIGAIATGGPLILAYLGLAWAMPKDSDLTPEERMRIIRES